MRTKRCKVMWGRDHLADLWFLDDGRWQLQPTETHVPANLLQHVKLFDPYVGINPPRLVVEWCLTRNTSLDPVDPIGGLLRAVQSSTGLRFEREGR